ncbi:hypothetical protein [Coxiella-like endosymbiont]|uniref:hypothetical protein n=1 Tax=Coxiella-like endosymbiont TaxID=1592897 RepID=UPI00272D02BA|nr:hypothetical protein [Coxiella-like endosymbiont]
MAIKAKQITDNMFWSTSEALRVDMWTKLLIVYCQAFLRHRHKKPLIHVAIVQ